MLQRRAWAGADVYMRNGVIKERTSAVTALGSRVY